MLDEHEEGGFQYWRSTTSGRLWRIERFKHHTTAEACALTRDIEHPTGSRWVPRATVSGLGPRECVAIRTRGAISIEELIELIELVAPGVAPVHAVQLAEAEVRV